MAQIFNLDQVKNIIIVDGFLHDGYVWREERTMGMWWWKKIHGPGLVSTGYTEYIRSVEKINERNDVMMVGNEVHHRPRLILYYGDWKLDKTFYFDTIEEAKEFYGKKIENKLENKLVTGW